MKCLKCNAKLTDGDLFCVGCGSSVEELKMNNLLQVNNIQAINDDHNLSSQDIKSNNTNTNLPSLEKQGNSQVDAGLKKTKPKMFLVTLVLAILVFVCGLGYHFLFNPKSIFNVSLNKINEMLENSMIFTNKDTILNEFSYKSNVNTNDSKTNEIFKILNNISLDGKVQLDYKNRKGNFTFNTKYKEKELINLDAKLTNKKIYIYLNDLFEKYIGIEIDKYDSLFEVPKETENYKIIVSEFIDTLKKSLKDKYFTREKSTIKISGKEEKVYKNILIIDDSNYIEIYKTVLNSLKENEKFLTNIAKINNESKQNIKNQIDEIVKSFDDTVDIKDKSLKIIIYTKGLINSFVGIEMNVVQEEENVNISVIKIDKNSYSVSFKTNENEILGNIKFSSQNEAKTINVSITVDGNTLGFQLSYKTKYNENVIVNLSKKTVSIDELTDKDINSIMGNLIKKPGVETLLSDVQNLLNSNLETDYEY